MKRSITILPYDYSVKFLVKKKLVFPLKTGFEIIRNHEEFYLLLPRMKNFISPSEL